MFLHEIIPELRKKHLQQTAAATELRGITVTELSAVDDPASGFPDWLLLKAASGKTKLSDLSDDQLDMLIADHERAASENPGNDSLASALAKLRAERARRSNLSKSAPQGWGKRLVQSSGGRVIFR